MIAPGNSIVQITLGLAFVIASGYALGRIHQWYRDGNERDQSYRDGYDEASQSMFDMAVSTRVGTGAGAATSSPAPSEAVTPNDVRPSRHRQVNHKPVRTRTIPDPSGSADITVGVTRRRIVATAEHHVSGQRRHRAAI